MTERVETTLLDEARAVLEEHRVPIRTDELWRKIRARGLFASAGDTPLRTLSTELLRASLGHRVSGRRSSRPFYKAGEATFGLASWLSGDARAELERAEAALDASETDVARLEAADYQQGLKILREHVPQAKKHPDFQKICDAQKNVLQQFGPVFQRGRASSLTEDDVRAFLVFKNNQHWAGLQRLGPAITRDMAALREALETLFDEAKDLDERVDYAHARVPRLAQAVITPMLHMFAPTKYGVWNRVSEAGLRRAGLLPPIPPRSTLGERYAAINVVLQRLAHDLGIDLWSLDALWWSFETQDETPAAQPELPDAVPERTWIEITEEAHGHGGPGWELGKCLWSPTQNNAGAHSYELMREPSQGDLVLHFVVPADGGQRRIAGRSYVARSVEERADEPPDAGKWADMGRYYRVELERHQRFELAPPVDAILQRNRDLVRKEAEVSKHYPFIKYGDSVRIAQGRYLARCTPTLYETIIDVLQERTGVAVTPEADLAEIARDFATALRDAHVHFGARHDSLVRTFVSSLAAKRFLILTGLSGSGKTQLAIKLGQWLGGSDRYEVVPVRPDWTGPEALLGYEDALLPPSDDGRRAWCVPRTLEFMLRAARDPVNPYLLILDEMNLAHVERYFADVLSGLESEEAILPDLRDEHGVWRPAKRGMKLPLPDNLFIVGTINVDETTYLFSPKVLDRANTIEFRVDTDELPSDAAEVRRPVPARSGPAPLVAGFLEIARDDDWQLDNAPDFIDRYIEGLRTLHGALKRTGDEFGHRTFFEGLRLAALLAQAGSTTRDDVLDIFVLQKVLPRMHGARRRLEPVLKAVATFCVGVGTDDQRDAMTLPVSDAALPRSLAKIQRMFGALRANQFASFSD